MRARVVLAVMGRKQGTWALGRGFPETRGFGLGRTGRVAFSCKNKKCMRLRGRWGPAWCMREAVLGSSTEPRGRAGALGGPKVAEGQKIRAAS